MRITNISNSPYQVPLAGGGGVVLAPGETSDDIEIEEIFLAAISDGDGFWRIEDEVEVAGGKMHVHKMKKQELVDEHTRLNIYMKESWTVAELRGSLLKHMGA